MESVQSFSLSCSWGVSGGRGRAAGHFCHGLSCLIMSCVVLSCLHVSYLLRVVLCSVVLM